MISGADLGVKFGADSGATFGADLARIFGDFFVVFWLGVFHVFLVQKIHLKFTRNSPGNSRPFSPVNNELLPAVKPELQTHLKSRLATCHCRRGLLRAVKGASKLTFFANLNASRRHRGSRGIKIDYVQCASWNIPCNVWSRWPAGPHLGP